VSARILIVEDEPAISELLAVNLRHSGYVVAAAADCASARQLLGQSLPNLMILDWMLPDASGVDFAKRLRADARTRELPIIMLTARAQESDKLSGFDAGADDYLTKPFSTRELLARIKAILRRNAPELAADPIEIAQLRIEPEAFRVTAAQVAVGLSPTEFRLLHCLMRNADRVLSRARLLDLVWGDEVYVEERTVDVHIRRLRQALQPSGHDRMVETVRGGGYRFLPA
jgi:two-component system, OmpR family, phosphate regulon response regulator PhoB